MNITRLNCKTDHSVMKLTQGGAENVPFQKNAISRKNVNVSIITKYNFMWIFIHKLRIH